MRYFRSPWMWGITAALVLAAIFVFDLTPWVRGGFGWRWEYRPVMYPVAVYAAMLFVYVFLAWRLIKGGARPRTILALAFFASLLLPLLAVSLREGDVLRTLFARTFSIVASAQHWGAAQIDWAGGEWRNWTSVMARLGSHLATSPPAVPSLYALVGDGIERLGVSAPLARPLIAALCTDYRLYELSNAQVAAGWLGVLSPLWAALTVFPMYSLARRLDARADQAILLWPLVPALSGFAASSSTVFPLIAVVMFLPLAGMRSWRSVAVSGLLFGIATLVNFAMLPLAALFGFFMLIRWSLTAPQPPIMALVRYFALFTVSGLIPWMVWFALTGQTPLDVLEQALSVHLALARPYLFWFWFHVWDWAIWSGLAIVIAAVFAGLYLWRIRKSRPTAAAFALTLVLTLIALTLSGMTRGESGRIWLFLTPFLLIVATLHKSETPSRWLQLAFIQVILTFALIVAVDAYNAPDVPARSTLSAANTGNALATFVSSDGGEFALMAANVEESGSLNLEINGRTPTLSPVWFGVIAVDAEGKTIASGPQQPISQGERLPSTCWTSGTSASVSLTLPQLDSLTGDDFYVSLAAYGFEAGDPILSVETSDGIDMQVGLGPFRLND